MNTVNIIGRLGKDPEMTVNEKWTKTSLTVAIDRYNGKDKEKTTDWIDCIAWGSTANLIGEHFRKGRPIAITGNLKQETWEDRETGKKRSKLIVVVDRVTFAGDAKKEGSGSGSTGSSRGAGSGAGSREDLDAIFATDDEIPF